MGCWMIKIIRYGLLMICLFFAAQKMFIIAQHQSSDPKQLLDETTALETKKQCRNLICLFGDKNDEQLFGENHATVDNLINALREQVAPIIVTTEFLRHFCYWKTHSVEVMRNLKLRGMNIIGVHLTDKNWHCYAHKKGALMLLMPKKYIETHGINHGNDIRAQMESCGFDVSDLDKINDVSPSTVLQYIDSHKQTYDDIIDYFESMFIKNRNVSFDAPLWNIYVMGHGGISFTDRSITAEIITQREDKLKEAMIAESASAGEIEKYEDSLRYWQEMSHELKKYGIIRKGSMAGLPANSFMQLLSFFAKEIRTSYLHYDSCFSGGSNQASINEQLLQIDVNYIISAQGVNESVTYSFASIPFSSPKVFINFFTTLEQFFCNSAQFVARQKGITKDPIAEIVSTVVNKEMIDWTQPFVRIPKVGVFNAFAVDKKVKILTNVIARAHELEGMPIDCTDPEIQTIVVYPSYIGAPLKINKGVAIVSPAPQIVAQKETIHLFEKVIYNDRLCNVIANFVSFNTRYEPIIFVIKELYCFDYAYSGLGAGDKKPIVVKDLILHIKGSGTDYYLDVATHVIFSLNSINYSLEHTIGELQNSNISALFKQLCNRVISVVNRSDFNRLAEVIAGSVAIKNFAKDEMSLSRIVEHFENKVTRSVRVEKPGSLKNVLLRKRLDSLERSITQEALNEQKAWLKSKNKSVVSLIRSLDRYKKEAENLSNEIDALSMEGQDTQLYSDLKTRIINASNSIKKEYELAVSQLSWFEYAAMKMSSFHVPSPYNMAKKVGAAAVNKIVVPVHSKLFHVNEFSKPR